MTRAEKVPYQIAWRWRDGTSVQFDDVQASTVAGALRTLRERLGAEYVLARGDIVALEVYRI